MSGVGFSIPPNAGIDVAKIHRVLDAQSEYASDSVNSDKYQARVQAVGMIVSAFINKSHNLPSPADMETMIKKIGAALQQV